MSNFESLKNDFPALAQTLDDMPLCYLDSAASSQKPKVVINSIEHFYRVNNANVHRGLHTLSERATTQYEAVRKKIADFLKVSDKEIVWTSGATESLNFLAHGLSESLKTGDIILLSPLEHHANIVPWQEVAKRTGATIACLPIDNNGVLRVQESLALIDELKPKIMSIGHASNALGNINPIDVFIRQAKKYNTITIIDGAQSLMHLRPNLKELACDFYVFSAHKCLGPTGLGGLYGRYELLNALPVYKTGGEMIETVSFEKSVFREAPAKFEPGTPNISAVIGFGHAIDYLNQLDKYALFEYEHSLYTYLLSELNKIDGIKVFGDLENNIGIASFKYKEEHHYDIATLLNTYGVAVRSGHHCTQPLMSHLNINGTVRVSLAFYNTVDDINYFISSLKSTIDMLD